MPSPWPMDDDTAKACASGLYVVATPIGNLEDITLRALRILASVELIAAEDTRHTARLLAHHEIHTPLTACHEHNEQARSADLVARIDAGGSVALVSDAGTPSVSDPGFRLVQAVIAAGLPLFPIPGVSAAITALCASGLPTNTFRFVGFAPKKKGRRRELLRSLADESATLIFYESPQRVVAFMDEIRQVMGDRPAVLGRELTKLHEEFLRGPLSQIAGQLAARSRVRGECTLLVVGKSDEAGMTDEALAEALQQALARPGARLSAVAKALARQAGRPRQQVYNLALQLQKGEGGDADASDNR